jgi:HEPN domain-containing protein
MEGQYAITAEDTITKKLVTDITKIVNTDTIFLLGKKINSGTHIFTHQIANVQTVAYWLLILITGDEKRHKMFQEEIEQKCNAGIAVSCIVAQTSTFQRWINEASPFAFSVVQKKQSIYNTNLQLESWYNEIINKEIPKIETNLFQKCFDLFNEYIAGAGLFTIRKYYRLALFMYHQATELLLIAFIKSKTGLVLHTHNINHLNSYLSFLFPDIARDFWGTTHREQDAFRLLQKSYCSSRYDECFNVKYKHLEIVQQKVNGLIQSLKIQASI